MLKFAKGDTHFDENVTEIREMSLTRGLKGLLHIDIVVDGKAYSVLSVRFVGPDWIGYTEVGAIGERRVPKEQLWGMTVWFTRK